MKSSTLSFWLLALSIVLVVLISGCVQTKEVSEKVSKTAEEVKKGPFEGAENIAENPIAKCITLCHDTLRAEENLSNGPCLSNNISANYVCDVAHEPRAEVDNLPENQCEAYRNRTAKHFVEVDTECNLIRTS